MSKKQEFDSNGLPTKPLRLANLPQLVMKKAMNYMTPAERVRLAVVSDKMEQRVKAYCNKKTYVYFVKMSDVSSSVDLGIGEGVNVAVTDTAPVEEMDGEQITKRQIQKWCDDKKTAIENTGVVLEKLHSLFSTSSDILELGLTLNASNERILEVISSPEFQDAQHLFITTINLSTDTIDKIMDMAQTKKFLFFSCLFPIDYYHENAFKCSGIGFCDSGWVRSEQLLSCRNKTTVILGNASMEWAEISLLLRFWMNADYDMFDRIKIDLKENLGRFDSVGAVQLDGFPEIEGMFKKYDGAKYYLILSKSTVATKKNQIGIIQKAWREFEMIVKPIHEFQKYVEILKLATLRERRDYAMRILEEQQMDIGFDDVPGIERPFLEGVGVLQRRLEGMNVRFVNGQAILVNERLANVAPAQEEA